MKTETKAKIKKALKWTGFAVLCAFACFGSVVACSLIARSANGTEAQNTAEASATQRADFNPRRAPTYRRALDPAEYPTLGEGDDNLLAEADYSAHRVIVRHNDEIALEASTSWDCYGIGVPSGGLPTGVYRLDWEHAVDSETWCAFVLLNDNGYANITDGGEYPSGAFAPSNDASGYYSSGTPFSRTFIVNNVNGESFRNLIVSARHGETARLTLLNALDVPASDVLTLPSDWSPSAWVSNRSLGGYPLLATTYTTSGNAGNSSLRVGWSNVMFRTANDDRVFTQFRVEYRWMWNGAKFRTRQGQEGVYDWDAGVADNYILFPYRVDFFDRLANQWFQVAEQDYQWGTQSYAIITDRLKWINERYRTLYFIDYPENPQFPTISEYTTDLWVTTNPLPIVMRYGLTFGDWFGLGSGWASPTITDVGTGDAIGVIRSAFSGLLPILNIAILPNITLGLLLFLPMIGGIIILIIKAVNK